jgi:sugar phosphate isomerase/epimerase
MTMKVSIVTDEVSSDPETALEIISQWGVKYCEIRGIGDQRFPEVTDYWHYRLPQLVQEFGLSVAAISPGLFRTVPPGHARPPMNFTRGGDVSRVRQRLEAERLRDHHIETLLPVSIEAAQRLGAKTIICFSFSRLDHTEGDLVDDGVIQVMRHAAQQVGAAGLTLNIEVGEATQRSVDVVRRVNHPALGINWDPANAFNGGEDDVFPTGFEIARPFIRHVHFKDVRCDPDTDARPWTLEGGVMDWEPMLAGLAQDDFQGFVTVETHFRPKVESTRRTLERLRTLIRAVGVEAV